MKRASEAQVNYILELLPKAGYPSRHMTAAFKELGAKMKQRSGPVQDWVEGLSMSEASKLIDTLKRKTGNQECAK